MKPVNHKIANVKARGNDMTYVYVVAGKCSCRTKGGGGRGIGMHKATTPPPSTPLYFSLWSNMWL